MNLTNDKNNDGNSIEKKLRELGIGVQDEVTRKCAEKCVVKYLEGEVEVYFPKRKEEYKKVYVEAYLEGRYEGVILAGVRGYFENLVKLSDEKKITVFDYLSGISSIVAVTTKWYAEVSRTKANKIDEKSYTDAEKVLLEYAGVCGKREGLQQGVLEVFVREGISLDGALMIVEMSEKEFLQKKEELLPYIA